MTNIEIARKAGEIYSELHEIHSNVGHVVDTKRRNTTIETELVMFSDIEAAIRELQPNKPFITVTVGLRSVRGKVAKRWAYFETLEDANRFIDEFSEVRIIEKW